MSGRATRAIASADRNTFDQRVLRPPVPTDRAASVLRALPQLILQILNATGGHQYAQRLPYT
jgi:hypothetical protein